MATYIYRDDAGMLDNLTLSSIPAYQAGGDGGGQERSKPVTHEMQKKCKRNAKEMQKKRRRNAEEMQKKCRRNAEEASLVS